MPIHSYKPQQYQRCPDSGELGVEKCVEIIEALCQKKGYSLIVAYYALRCLDEENR